MGHVESKIDPACISCALLYYVATCFLDYDVNILRIFGVP